MSDIEKDKGRPHNSVIVDLSDGSREASEDDPRKSYFSSEDEESEFDTGSKAPPSRISLEREKNKLRTKHKIVKESLLDDQLAAVDEEIAVLQEKGNSPTMEKKLEEQSKMKQESMETIKRKKEAAAATILKEYDQSVRNAQGEKKGD